MRSEVRASPEAEHTVWWLLLCRAVEQRVRAANALRAVLASVDLSGVTIRAGETLELGDAIRGAVEKAVGR